MASGVETEFPYRVRIVDRGLIAATLFAATISDSQSPGFGVLGAAPPPASTFVLEPRIVRLSYHFASWALGLLLGSAARSSLPPVQKQDAQHMFLQHRGAHAESSPNKGLRNTRSFYTSRLFSCLF